MTLKKLRRILLLSSLFTCALYVYFVKMPAPPVPPEPGLPVPPLSAAVAAVDALAFDRRRKPAAAGGADAVVAVASAESLFAGFEGGNRLPAGQQLLPPAFSSNGTRTLALSAKQLRPGSGYDGYDGGRRGGGSGGSARVADIDVPAASGHHRRHHNRPLASYVAAKVGAAPLRPERRSADGIAAMPSSISETVEKAGAPSKAGTAGMASGGSSEGRLDPGRPWFFHNGGRRPLPGERGNLWPHEDPDSDRIVDQLMFMPLNQSGPLKKIFLQRGSWGGLPLGQNVFLRDDCPVNRCTITDDAESADALIFKDRYLAPPGRRKPNQVYILYLLECPMHTPVFRDLGPVFNWTATYRHDSDIVAPYEKWVSYSEAGVAVVDDDHDRDEGHDDDDDDEKEDGVNHRGGAGGRGAAGSGKDSGRGRDVAAANFAGGGAAFSSVVPGQRPPVRASSDSEAFAAVVPQPLPQPQQPRSLLGSAGSEEARLLLSTTSASQATSSRQRSRKETKAATNFERRTKDVVWFVSNCNARNGRLQFARRLAEHIGVDVFGACSNKKCPRYNRSCFEMLDTTYKFYLAFENSNCRDYITEKFFVNGLNHTIVPVVMGARKSEYARAAPPDSFIHVDDFRTPRELADYLREVGADRRRWERYVHSRSRGQMINTFFFCRLCAMLHDDVPPKVYPDIHSWWAGRDVCTPRSWPPEPRTPRQPAYVFL